MAELAFKFPVPASLKMTHGLLELKCFATLILTCVIHCEAFLIKVINKVFDFHWVLRFIATVSSAAQNIQVVIDFFGKKIKVNLIKLVHMFIASSAISTIIGARSTKDHLTILILALYSLDSDLVACKAFKGVKK